MDKNMSAEQLSFALFVDAVKRKDKMQFAYFDLYFNIAHGEELSNISVEEEGLSL